MKGEYGEQQAKASDPPNMFSKLHHHPFSHHPFHLSHESQTSEEDDTRSASTAPNHLQKPMFVEISFTTNGSSIEAVRCLRGYPLGSFILEVLGGMNVVEAIAHFFRLKSTTLNVLKSDIVANITLRQPSTTPRATVTFHSVLIFCPKKVVDEIYVFHTQIKIC